MHLLQSLVLPSLDLPLHESLYLRLHGRAWTELGAGRVHLQAGDVLSTDTFYNGLTVDMWKRVCGLRSLALRVAGEGEYVVTLGQHRAGHPPRWLAQRVVATAPGRAVRIALDCWDDVNDGMLFVQLRALVPGVLSGMDYLTDDPPRRAPRLGIVITHYNRQRPTQRAVQRIRARLLDQPEWQDALTLTVVDNSRNLAIEPHPRIHHIPSRNLGGTGGFVRGLLGLIDSETHSHALFMDDDASCETESIARTLAVLRHAVDDRVAVAGALLRDGTPWELIEKGARFDGQVRALHRGLHLRRTEDLLTAERPGDHPDYGAWWFFAFPIAEVRHFPFPFFVRGDDIHFGLVNRFEIVTLNGVASLGEDFGAKHGPMTAYLDARYHLVHAFMARSGTAARVWWVGARLFTKALGSYLYDSARAVTLALEHTREGPEFFRRNLDMQAVRAQVASWQTNEALKPLDRTALNPRPARARRESRLRRCARALTLQGFLLPRWMVRDRTALQTKAFHGRASEVFLHRRVLYECPTTGDGFLAEFDRPRFFAELGRFLAAWAGLFTHLAALRQAYAQGSREMTTEAFWRGVYGDEAPAAPRPAVLAAAPPARATTQPTAVEP